MSIPFLGELRLVQLFLLGLAEQYFLLVRPVLARQYCLLIGLQLEVHTRHQCVVSS